MAVGGVHGNTDLVSQRRVMREAECARVCMHAYVCVGELYLREQEATATYQTLAYTAHA